MSNSENINRLKVVLAEQCRTSKWLAEQLKKTRQQSLNGVQTLRNQVWKL